MSEQREFIRAQLSSGVDYYKGEKGDKPVKGVDYFTPADIESIVEQIEAGNIDFSAYATKEYVDGAIENIDITETDPTVPSWAKAPNKPSYTASEVGALPDDTALFSGDYDDLSNKPTIPVVPTNVSSFTNDAGYLTQHQSLSDYATKSYVEQVVAGIETGALKRSVVQSLPISNIDENTIYMVARSGASGTDIYDEYLRVNNAWEKIGSTQVDLTNYALKSELFSGSYNDLTDKPTIPAAYTLPTASTSTLGGVKVDGTTITISDGVISSVGGGSSSAIVFNTAYDADTNKAATMADVDDAVMNAELPASAIAAGMNEQHEPVYLNEVLHNIETTLSGKQDSLVFNTAYNSSSNKVATMADIPAAYSLPTATTSTLGGVKVDGSTITISNGVISAATSSSLPSNPSNDGTYFLKNVVSSGVATQSWESVVIGGSY